PICPAPTTPTVERDIRGDSIARTRPDQPGRWLAGERDSESGRAESRNERHADGGNGRRAPHDRAGDRKERETAQDRKAHGERRRPPRRREALDQFLSEEKEERAHSEDLRGDCCGGEEERDRDRDRGGKKSERRGRLEEDRENAEHARSER